MAVINAFDGEGFSFSHSVDTEPQDSFFPLHIHQNLELFCLVKGNVGYLVEGRKYRLYPGTVLLMRSGESHKLTVNGQDEYERYVINFTPEFLTENGFDESILTPFFNRELGQKNRYVLKDFYNISPIFLLEKAERESLAVSPKCAVLSTLSSLLCTVNVSFLQKNKRELDDNSIITFVNENLTKDISLKDISEYSHLSTSQLCRTFKSLTGTSVHEYILTKRLILFEEKLKRGKSAVCASLECGFHDYSAFYRLYKKRFGHSPTKKIKSCQ